MKIAVVILNWNGVKLMNQFLPSVIKYSGDAAIYIADNDSTDDSVVFVKNNFPSVKIIQNNHNFGFAKGYNQALKNIDSDIFALINSDVEVTENWLEPIIKTFQSEPKTAILQPKILDFKRKDYFEYAGAAGGFMDKYGFMFCRGRIFETIEKDTNQYNDTCEIFWASGACFFIRANVFRELKGFDDDFFAHQEEIDLCWRAFNKGYEIKYLSESVVYHIGGATLQKSNPKKTFLNFRNSLLMLLKNLPKNQILPILFFRIILDGFAGLKFLFEGEAKHCIAVIKAHFEFYKMASKNYKKRDVQQTATYYQTKSIVYTYFVLRIKQFNKIF